MSRPTANQIIGANMRTLREASGLTLKEVAERMSLDSDTVERIETGKLALYAEEAQCFATAVRCSISMLVAGLQDKGAA